jgi:DNA-3-methyladenine glycosylase
MALVPERTLDEIAEALARDVLEAAPLLLGSVLVRGSRRARIVEVEAYRAEGDPGCHAHRGMTRRNQVMFDRPGLAYVYFNYGVHWMLNVVAHQPGSAAAILVRAAEPLEGLEEMKLLRPKARRIEDLLSGPGKLAAAFSITGEDNGLDLLSGDSPLRIEPGMTVERIVTGPRIGLAPGKGDELPWRYADAARLAFVSKPVRTLR